MIPWQQAVIRIALSSGFYGSNPMAGRAARRSWFHIPPVVSSNHRAIWLHERISLAENENHCNDNRNEDITRESFHNSHATHWNHEHRVSRVHHCQYYEYADRMDWFAIIVLNMIACHHYSARWMHVDNICFHMLSLITCPMEKVMWCQWQHAMSKAWRSGFESLHWNHSTDTMRALHSWLSLN